ncbi:DUF479 domain-containing protein [Candidatus Gottesmanbacteria bacterium]|nr:DUF479 domain-containing protein [Candidatus Gottesmanbacteria bacterium]
MFGAVCADLLRNRPVDGLGSEIQAGRTSHLQLDAFFDSLKSLAPCRNLLFNIGSLKHYSGPVLDVCADYVIGKNWNLLFNGRIEDFVLRIHNALITNIRLLPEKARASVTALVNENQLLAYRDQAGLGMALDRLAIAVGKRNWNNIVEGKPKIMSLIPIIEPFILAALPDIRAHMQRLVAPEYTQVARLVWREGITISREHASVASVRHEKEPV